MRRQAPGREVALHRIHRAAQRAADDEAVLEGLAHVPVAAQVVVDLGVLDLGVVQRERARLRQVGAVGERAVDRLRGEHAAPQRVVHALQARHVDEARGVAEDHRAGRRHARRHRPEAALGDRLGAPGDALAALEHAPEERMALDLLQQVVHRERGVGVVEADDESEAERVGPHRVGERAAELAVARLRLERPADRVHDALQRALDAPHLLDAQRVDLGVLGLQAEVLDRGAGEHALDAVGQHRRVRGQLGAGLERR